MRTEQRKRPIAAAAVLVALTLPAGCGSVTPDGPPVGAGPAAQESGPAAGYSPAPVAVLPAELVGSWSADDPQGVGSWTLEFAADGAYREYNLRRAVTFSGQALVHRSRLYLQPNGADSQTVTWRVDEGRLSLDGSVFRRTLPAGRDGTAPAGS
jgi:hypothetical protein